MNFREALSKLTPEQYIQIVEDFDQEFIPSDAFIRQIASELFSVDINRTNLMQLQCVVMTISPLMAKELKKRL